MNPTCYIWKYKAKHTGGMLNYFTGEANLDFIDRIDVSADIMDMPVYSERLEKQSEILEFTAGDFDVKISLMRGTQSVNGDSASDFFFGTGDRNFLYVVVLMFGQLYLNPKMLGGKISPSNIQWDSVNEAIQFTVVDILREMSDYFSLTKLSQVDAALYPRLFLDDFLKGSNGIDTLFSFDAEKFGVSESLNLSGRFGVNRPMLIKELWNDLVGSTDQNTWGAFKDIARGFGFLFTSRVYISSFNPISTTEWPTFQLHCFWRSGGVTQAFGRMTDITGNADINSSKYYFMMTYRDTVLDEAMRHAGILLCPDGAKYIADNTHGTHFADIAFLDDELTEVFDVDKSTALAKSTTNFFAIATYETKWQISIEGGTTYLGNNAKESFFSCFCTNYIVIVNDPINHRFFMTVYGQRTILNNCSTVEYTYLCGGLKRMKEYEIVLDNPPTLKIGDLITDRETSYWLKSLSDINLQEETAKTEWIEV